MLVGGDVNCFLPHLGVSMVYSSYHGEVIVARANDFKI